MRVEYRIGFSRCQSEYIGFEHTGYALYKAKQWWVKRSDAPIPESAAEAVFLAQAGAICETQSITVRRVAGERFDDIIDYELGTKPVWREPGWDEDHADQLELEYAGDEGEEVPF